MFFCEAKFVNCLMQRAGELLEKLESVDADTKIAKDEKGDKFYRKLMETFDAFDQDGAANSKSLSTLLRFLNQTVSISTTFISFKTQFFLKQ